MTNLIKRALTGAVYVALIVCSLLFGGDWGFPLLSCLFAAGALIEFYRMGEPQGSRPSILSLDIAAGVLLTASPLAIAFHPNGIIYVLALICVAIVARSVAQLYSTEDNAFTRLSISMAGIVYISLPLAIAAGMSIWLSPMVVLALFVMLWLNDTGAYLVGSRIGKRRLMERISPKKSWEGFFGGLFFTAAGAAAMTPWIMGTYTPANIAACAIMGLIISVAATWGDLVESMLKRSRGVKDAGHILPGHGGVLDRIDSLLIASPVMALLQILLMAR